MNCVVVAASLSLIPAALCAQTCMGGASFADRRAQIGADASFSTGTRSLSGDLSIGSSLGQFASVGFGRTHTSRHDDDATVFAATAGIGVPRRVKPGTQICPFISAVVLNGVEFDTFERLSSHAFGFGASVGRILSPRSGFELVPFGSFAFVVQTTTTFHPPPLNTTADTDNHRTVSLGAGLVFAKVIAIRPSTTFTIAGGRTTTSHGVHVSLGFGGVARPRVIEGAGSLTTVWVNSRAGVYYCPGSRWYGATAYGSFMTEREAVGTGATPEHGRRC
jgi:hypothetical protein